jgi:hypothetical protein
MAHLPPDDRLYGTRFGWACRRFTLRVAVRATEIIDLSVLVLVSAAADGGAGADEVGDSLEPVALLTPGLQLLDRPNRAFASQQAPSMGLI